MTSPPVSNLPATPIPETEYSTAPAKRLEFQAPDCGALPVAVRLSRFRGPGGVDEVHLTARPTEYGSVETQLDWVQRAYRLALRAADLEDGTAVFRRFFCSDLSNQAAALEARPFSNPRAAGDPCAVSWVRQPPAPPVKVALWACHVADPAGGLDKTLEGPTLTVRRGALSHHWTTGVTCPGGETSHDQTNGIYEKYDAWLESRGLSLAGNVVRTWLFVRNIDANYAGLVSARREFFAARGLTPDTHFIASTGIEGAHADVAARVTMDAWAIGGLRAEQVRHLSAPEHLSPTHVYGVTFERATSVAWRDRKHVLISGTASIDREGRIIHPGDVSRQLDRTLENIEALLRPAAADLGDVAMFIVYVRDPSDAEVAWRVMRDQFGDAPVEVVTAPVCRPGWLIEVEGLAIVAAENPGLPEF